MARQSSGFGTEAFISAALALALICAALPARAGPVNSGTTSGAEMDQGLERLAEILGSVHHLREICGANEGALWRNKMIDMMNVAALDAEHRQRMISHFNEGYYQAQTAFPGCSGRAAARANALFDEAHRLAARLAGTDRSAAADF